MQYSGRYTCGRYSFCAAPARILLSGHSWLPGTYETSFLQDFTVGAYDNKILELTRSDYCCLSPTRRQSERRGGEEEAGRGISVSVQIPAEDAGGFCVNGCVFLGCGGGLVGAEHNVGRVEGKVVELGVGG